MKSGIRLTDALLVFVLRAQMSKGGISLICLASTYTTKDGALYPRIVPTVASGTITTTLRQLTDYIVTEYGARQVRGKPRWMRAGMII